ncbi:MFS transporter [Methylopila sp. M107]|uniref:MFS transporter n=1 Tax=Methylopila sp. M107 TaxID=1101190 RepID=UPI00068861A3|nr:MFS transporter [Methylopila sp. M107]
MTTHPIDIGVTPTVAQSFRRAQWKMLFATMFCYLFFYTGRQTFGFAIPGIQAELGFSKAQLGWVSATMLWCYAIGQAINGNLGDKYGGRRMMTAGAVFSCATNWVLSFSTGLFSLGALWGVNGYFQALGWAPGSRLLSNWWGSSERGKVYGFYLFASGSAAIMSFLTSVIIIDVMHLDWRWIFRIPVLLMLFGGITYFFIVRDKPEDLGFKSPHDDDALQAGPDAGVDSGESSFQRYKAVLKNWRLSVAGLTIGFANAARYGLIVWVPVHFLGSGLATAPGGRWISIALPCGMAIGAITNGWVSDRVFGSHRGNAIGLYMLLAVVSTGAMYFVPHDQRMLGIAMLFLSGFFVFGPYASLYALCPDLVGVKRAGTATGILNFFSYALGGLIEPLIGWILDHYPDTSNVFLVVCVASALGFLTSLLIKR